MAELLRHLAACGIGLLGCAGVVLLSVGMNRQTEVRLVEPVAVLQEVAAAPRAKPEQARRARPARSSSASRKAAPSAAPLLAASLAGLDFGLAPGADLAVAGATEALVGQLGGAVLREDEVAEPPRATRQAPPAFPARARALGQSGSVTLSFVVDVDGSVQDVHVVAAEPPGVFDEAAAAAARDWAFEPGRKDGVPVAVRVRQTLRFALE